MHPRALADWRWGDIHIACAFDVDARKIGKRVGDAIFAPPNNAQVFCRDPRDDGARVHAGPVLDGLASHLSEFDEAKRAVLARESRTMAGHEHRGGGAQENQRATVLINYLPVGSQKASRSFIPRPRWPRASAW